MPKCPSCEKEVYFAERCTSLGKDWHRGCLRCADQGCKKTLTPGSHDEHQGKPYCKKCYGVNFGPSVCLGHVIQLTMPKCPTCQKEVYFAEKVTSLGKDWHRGCLRCEKCKKTLSSGSHAEREGKPYCHNPCYSSLFGPGGVRSGGSGAANSYQYNK
ncbi:cysteine-rich protein 2-like [Amphiura filiformis]|uniref:cysteine-rich protein 2-like n=1 Tax=Amphiura filiformis TaxID=82378 RepID=UPI003B218390